MKLHRPLRRVVLPACPCVFTIHWTGKTHGWPWTIMVVGPRSPQELTVRSVTSWKRIEKRQRLFMNPSVSYMAWTCLDLDRQILSTLKRWWMVGTHALHQHPCPPSPWHVASSEVEPGPKVKTPLEGTPENEYLEKQKKQKNSTTMPQCLGKHTSKSKITTKHDVFAQEVELQLLMCHNSRATHCCRPTGARVEKIPFPFPCFPFPLPPFGLI